MAVAIGKWNEKLEKAQSGQEAAEKGVQEWQKKLNNAKTDLNSLSDEVEKNNNYLSEAEKSTDGCAKSIDEYGKEVQEAEKDTDSFSDKLKNGIAEGAKAAGESIAAVGAAAAAGIKFLNDIAESTEEYREAQGKLNTAFEAAGFSTQKAKEAYQTLFSVLGDTDNATESAQLLAQLAKSEEDVAAWGEIAAGVTGTFGDALPINSLIEAANETAKVGEVTGTLADALNWVGISEDEFNEKLAACSDETERTNLITETLSDTYQNASNIFKENNETLIEARKAQADLDETMAKLGGTVAEVKAELTAEFAPSIAEVAEAFVGLAEGAEGAEEDFARAVDGLIQKAAEKLPELLEFGTNIIVNVLSGIANAAPQLAEGAITVVTELSQGLIAALPQLAEAAAQLIGGIVQGIAEASPELLPVAAGAVAQFVKALIDNIPYLMEAALQLIEGLAGGILAAIPVLLEATPEIIESLINALVEAIPEIAETGVELLSAMMQNLPDIIHAIVTALPEIITSISGALLESIPEIATAGVELLTALINDLPVIIAEIVSEMPQIISGIVDTLKDGIPQLEDIGENLVRGLWDGIQSLAGWLWDKVSAWINSIWDGITDFFGIASPSKQMAWVGEMLVDGLAGAISDKGGKATAAVGEMASDMLSEMETYADNIQRAMEMGVDEGLIRKLSDGSEESAQILAAIVEGGTEDIEALNEQLARVEEGKENFSDTVADMETDFKEKMKDLVQDLKDTIQEMDLSDEAFKVGMNNIQGLIDGTADMRYKLVAEYEDMAYAAIEAYRRIVDQASPSKKFKQIGRYDIEGIIRGAEEEKQNLSAKYEDVARAALNSMRKHLPSTLEDPAPAAERRTVQILEAAVNGESAGGTPIQIYVDKLEVREEADIERVARELYYMTEQRKRERGGGTL